MRRMRSNEWVDIYLDIKNNILSRCARVEDDDDEEIWNDDDDDEPRLWKM